MRAALSRLSFLTLNTSASYRTTYYTRSADAGGRVTDEPLTRQYLTLRSDVVGPVLAKIWDTPGSGYSERMKHLIEPTFALEYIPAISNAAQRPDAGRLERRHPGRLDATHLRPQQPAALPRADRRRLGRVDHPVPDRSAFSRRITLTERASLNDTQYVST